MTWRRTGDKPLSEPVMTQFNDICMRQSASMNYARFTPNSRGTWDWLTTKNGQTRGYSGVGRQGRMFLLCYSPEGHKLHLDTRDNSGLLTIEIYKLYDHF